MPKMKTHSGAKKRFKVLGSGKIKRAAAYRRHCLGHMTTKSKRQLRKDKYVCACDQSAIARLLAS